MPATLGHIGVQLVVSKTAIAGSDTKWALLACVLPDIPWILQRVVVTLTDMPPIVMRSYAIGQGSLLVCLLLCLGLAQFSRVPGTVFRILGLGAVLHLLLDAAQTKYGNGVILFAPFNWDMTGFDLFWPEDIATLIVLALGLLVAVVLLVRRVRELGDLVWPSSRGCVVAAMCLVGYVTLPFAFFPAVTNANLNYVATIGNFSDRAGKLIEIDRNRVEIEGGTAVLTTWFGERIILTGMAVPSSGRVSLQGRFVDARTIYVTALHFHPEGMRDSASLLGLLFVLFWWVRVILRRIG